MSRKNLQKNVGDDLSEATTGRGEGTTVAKGVGRKALSILTNRSKICGRAKSARSQGLVYKRGGSRGLSTNPNKEGREAKDSSTKSGVNIRTTKATGGEALSKNGS